MTPLCKVSRYRPTNAICNNVENPHWGAAMNGHHRFLSPDFSDGISAPKVSYYGGGAELPSPRVVSTAAHNDQGFHDHAVTTMLLAWGQFIDHGKRAILLRTEIIPQERS